MATAKGGAAAPPSPPAVITVAPDQTTAGSTFSVTGSGLRSRQVALLLLGQQRLVRFQAQRSGDWSLTTRIPRRTTVGASSLRVLASNRQVIAVKFRITAKSSSGTSLTELSTGQQLQLLPNRGPAGSPVALIGNGFNYHETLGLWLDRTRLVRFTATSRGSLGAFVRVPSNVRPGSHLLSLRFGRSQLNLSLNVTKPPAHTRSPRPPPPSPPTTATTTTTTSTSTTTTTTTPTPSADPVIVAAGDLACTETDPANNADGPGQGDLTATNLHSNCLQQSVSDVALAANPTAFLTLGDNENGISPNFGDGNSTTDFPNVYGPTFGRLNSVVYPEVGNGDYNTSSPPADTGFMQYFPATGLAARIQTNGGDTSHLGDMYYSFNLGSWHIIALNTECAAVPGGCGVGSLEETWLRHDLMNTPAGTCTLAYWHVPVWNSVSQGTGSEGRAFWNDLYGHADIVLNGHGNNHYETFGPLGPYPSSGTPPTYGTADAQGIREFIVSNGGFSHGNPPSPFVVSPTTSIDNGTAAVNYTSMGVLKLTLHSRSYDWQFLNATPAFSPFSDSGSGTCH